MPFRVWTSQPVTSADFNDYIQEQVIASFPSAAARDTGAGSWTAPQDGAMSWLLDSSTPWVYRAGAWKPHPLGVLAVGTGPTAQTDYQAPADISGTSVTVPLVTG